MIPVPRLSFLFYYNKFVLCHLNHLRPILGFHVVPYPISSKPRVTLLCSRTRQVDDLSKSSAGTSKTEVVILTNRWAYDAPLSSIGGYPIALSKHVRYLGVILDSRLSFGKYDETFRLEVNYSMPFWYGHTSLVVWQRPRQTSGVLKKSPP